LAFNLFAWSQEVMKVTRGQFIAYRLQDAIETKAVNSKKKAAERRRRDARMMARISAGSLPFTPDVMSWLSCKLEKPAR
jgi:hypothetical protein